LEEVKLFEEPEFNIIFWFDPYLWIFMNCLASFFIISALIYGEALTVAGDSSSSITSFKLTGKWSFCCWNINGFIDI